MARVVCYSLVVVTALGCMAGSGPTVAPHVSAAQQASAAASMRLSFPPESEFLLYHRDSDEPSPLPSPDDTVHLKIAMPPAVAANFLAARPFSDADWGVNARFIPDRPEWSGWKPSEIKKVRSSQIQTPQNEVLTVVVDEDSPEKTVLYLVWFDS